MRFKRNSTVLLSVLFAFVLCSGFICTGSQIHKATVAEHDFRVAVQGFQDAEIAEFNIGKIPQQLHQQFQSGIQQIAGDGQALAMLIQSNQQAKALQMTQNIDMFLQSLLSNDVTKIPDAQTKATIQIALQGIMDIITNVQVVLTK